MQYNYIPKYVRQESDIQYGDLVTHENYNEKLNLLITQGDYNTKILDDLFNNTDPEKGVKVPYLEADIKLFKEIYNEKVLHIEEDVKNITDKIEVLDIDIESNKTKIEDITQGRTVVSHANVADVLSGAFTAGSNKYYGTDIQGNVGFIELPEFIYAEDTHKDSVTVDGISILPQLNSVSEAMFTEEVRNKLNRTNLTDYEYLDNLPLINGVLLKGDVSLESLGIQRAGDFVTTMDLKTTIDNYTPLTTFNNTIADINERVILKEYLDEKLTEYTTTADLIKNYVNKTNSVVVQIGNEFIGEPKVGDILITFEDEYVEQ